MNELYFVRHAESEANKKRILGSQLAYPLTAAGKADADLIAGQFLEKIDIQRIISSPLLRARQTAESFADLSGLSVIIDDRMIEQHLGKYTGMGYDAVKAESGYEQNTLKRWNWVPEGGGESYKMISERVLDFFRSIEKNPLPGNTLIVTHAVTLRLINAVLADSLPEYPEHFPNNGEIVHVSFLGLGRHHETESIFLGNSRDFRHNP